MLASPDRAVLAEPSHGHTWRYYYYAGTTRLAVREVTASQNKLYYLLTDHLGSTAKAVEANTNTVVMELRYRPWGEVRYSSGTGITDYTYTGQKSEMADIGLLFYMSRFYDPALGRFIQADSIVPEPGNPLAWDRYAYVLNNPVRYTDPSGHLSCNSAHVAEGDCSDLTLSDRLELFGLQLEGDWLESDLYKLLYTAGALGDALAKYVGGSWYSAFKTVFGRFGALTVVADASLGGLYGQWTGGKLHLQTGKITPRVIAHELGHVFQSRIADTLNYVLHEGTANRSPVSMLSLSTIFTESGRFVTGLFNGSFDRYGGFGAPENGFYGDDQNDSDQWQIHPLGMEPDGNTADEQFADMFLNWTYGTFYPNSAGNALNHWMTINMADWVSIACARH